MGLLGVLSERLFSLTQAGFQNPEHSSEVVGELLKGVEGQGGGMGAILESLAANGLADRVRAWTTGEHAFVTPEELHDALGSEQVQSLVASSGLPVGDFLRHLADHLPAAASGVAPAAEEDQSVLNQDHDDN